MNYQTFVKTHPTCKVVDGSILGEKIYTSIIWNEENRIRMAEFSDMGLPALAAIVDQIEKLYEECTTPDIDFTIDVNKQVIGRMIATALEPLGYLPNKKKRIPKEYLKKYFKNATQYSRTGTASEKICKKIVQI